MEILASTTSVVGHWREENFVIIWRKKKKKKKKSRKAFVITLLHRNSSFNSLRSLVKLQYFNHSEIAFQIKLNN